MYEYLRRSDAGWRKTETKYEKEQKSLEGYEPSTEEKNKNKEPQQRLRMENAYGRITLGKNEDGEMTFVVTGKKSLQGKPAEQNEKVLVKDRAVRRREGVFTEHREGVTKTLTYKQDIQTKYKKEVIKVISTSFFCYL